MRTTILALATVALVVSACAGRSSGSSPAASQGGRPPDQHHVPTPDPWATFPDPTPHDDPSYEDPYGNPVVDPYPDPYVDPREDDVSTFALDIDTASYEIARRDILAGYLPDPSGIRVEEWVNAFEHDYPAPEDGAFSIVADGGPTPFTARDEVLLRVGLRARDIPDRKRDDAALTFVIDTSGSMADDNKLEIVKHALRRLVDGLGQGDTVAVVTFGDEARVVLPPTRASHGDEILGVIEQLYPGGSTNLEAGLRLGYDMARETLTERGIDRVVLASDGVANVGLTDPEHILGRIREDAAAGIELVSVGVGMGEYNDVLLEQLADDGDGFYAYVNTRDEAARLFTEDLTGTLQAVALDARAQVEFDPDVVDAYRLVGYENRAIADEDFTDDSVDAGAIGAGHDVTALYAVRLREDGREKDDPLAVIRLRWSDPDNGRAQEVAHPIRLRDLSGSFGSTKASFRLDALVAATAEVLQTDAWSGDGRIRDITLVADRERELLPPTDEAHEFLDLLDELARLEE
jgi:Ca-activated chloride channel family protein